MVIRPPSQHSSSAAPDFASTADREVAPGSPAVDLTRLLYPNHTYEIRFPSISSYSYAVVVNQRNIT